MTQEQTEFNLELEQALQGYERDKLAASVVFDHKTPLPTSDAEETTLRGFKSDDSVRSAADLPLGNGLEVWDANSKREARISIRPTTGNSNEVEVRMSGKVVASAQVGSEPVFISSPNTIIQEARATVEPNSVITTAKDGSPVIGTRITVPTDGHDIVQPLGMQVKGDRVRIQTFDGTGKEVTRLR